MRTTSFTLLVLFSLCALTCHKEPSPVMPPSSSDSLTTFVRILADGQEPAVSPDGTRIAFTNDGNIFVMDTSVRVTKSWNGIQFIYDTTGGNIKQLTFGGADVLPRWNPNNQSIGFVRSTPGQSNMGLIFSVPVSGGASTQLVFNQFTEDGNSSVRWDWSPDGKYIAFFSDDNETSRESLNVVLSSNGRKVYGVQSYYALAPSAGSSSFAWSLTPDVLAYSRQSPDPNGIGEVWLINLVSGEAIKDTSNVYLASDLCRSPIENKFAYDSYPVGSVKVEITDFRNRLNEYSVSSGGGLKWSYDEKYFVYQWLYIYLGPSPYNQERIALFSVMKNKEYLLIPYGDFNRTNLFFEWGRSPNTVYFERAGQINVVTFNEPK